MLVDSTGRPLASDRVLRDPVDGYEVRRDVLPEFRDELTATIEAAQSGRMDSALLNGANLDGFVNELTALGTTWGDKTRGGLAGGPRFDLYRMSGVEAELRYRGSDLGRNVVEKIPDEMTRRGWDIEVQPSDNDTDPGQDAGAHRDAARREPTRAAAGWRRIARSGRLDGRGQRIARDRARRWDEVAAGTMPPEAAPPPPPGPLPLVNEAGAELGEAIEKWASAIGVTRAVNQALRYERAYGGAAIFLGVDDGGRPLTEPLDPNSIRAITHLTVLRGGWDGEAVMWRPYNDPRKPKYGEPEIWQVRNTSVQLARPPAPGEGPISQALPGGPAGATIFYVHESRMIVFDGEPTSREARQELRGWGDSVFTRVNDPLAQYEQTWQAVSVLMQEFSIATLSVKGFAKALAEKGAAARENFIQLARLHAITQSVSRMRYIDSEETFSRVTASVAGVAEILREWALRLAAACDTPVSILFGKLSGGLGANEDPSMRGFYDRIEGRQENRLRPALEYLYRLAWRAKNSPTKGKEPDRWALLFRPLWQLTETELGDLYGKYANADKVYIDAQVVTPEEVAATRFGGPEFNTASIVIDLAGRTAQAESDLAASASEATKANADPLDALGTPQGASPLSSGAASVPVPPMTAMPRNPITGDPQATPSNVSSNTARRGDDFSESAIERVPAGGEGGGQFTSGGGAGGGGAAPAQTGRGKMQRAETTPIPKAVGPDGKPRSAGAGAQLHSETRAKLKALGVSKLPAAHIAEVHVSSALTGDGDPHKGPLMKWKDDKGRVQSVYSREHERVQAEKKFARVEAAAPKIEAAMKELHDKAQTSPAHAAVAVMAETGLRPGSDAGIAGHYGVTTMEARHVRFTDDGKAHIEYVGKEGVTNRSTIDHPKIVAALRAHTEGKEPGAKVFAAGRAAVAAAAPAGVKLKDLRTVIATQTAQRELDAITPTLTGDKKKDARAVVSAIKAVSTTVSTKLNNTPAMARKAYINPKVIKAWGEKHGLDPEWVKGPYDE